MMQRLKQGIRKIPGCARGLPVPLPPPDACSTVALLTLHCNGLAAVSPPVSSIALHTCYYLLPPPSCHIPSLPHVLQGFRVITVLD
ncbi:hypothetical protein P7K49_036904 [Saguinus oedipus]|uniref:Uncharacterized protein n=1 Tax=Saguinus oedipus TaxID=9490 RepID=A0ABQ9TLG4_SAGOE|nr:hypothetical protein P7K49_036904 [Saguinus oedipus]